MKNQFPTFSKLIQKAKDALVSVDKNVEKSKKETSIIPPIVMNMEEAPRPIHATKVEVVPEPIPVIEELKKEMEVPVIPVVPVVPVEVKHHEPLLLTAPRAPIALICGPAPAISFKNVTKSFDGKIAIDNVNFDIPQEKDGNIIAIVGPSGCGKSTILRIIAGLEPQYPQTSGEVMVLNKPILGTGIDRGMVDQKYSLLPHLTVLNNIAFGLKLGGMPKKERLEKAREWVKKVGLEGAENKYPQELSGGMQQRVSLASTLILHPKILLMDEPFGALDPKTRLRMQELLISLWKEVKGVIIVVTHSMEEAIYLGDHIFRMEANPGRLVEVLDAPRPYISPEEMRKMKWFNEMVQELLSRIEGGIGAQGEFSIIKRLREEAASKKDHTGEELQLLKLIS